MKPSHQETPPESADAGNGPAEHITREQRRSRRRREVRARTISVRRLSKREMDVGRAAFPPDEFADVERPRTRADCKDGVRPCPFVSCTHHLYLDVSERTGAIKVNFPDVEPDDLEKLPESCALDVAERGGETLEQVGAIMNLTRERIRQVEVKALAKCEAKADMFALRDFVSGGPVGKRRLPVLHDEDEREDEPKACRNEDADDEAGFDVESFASAELDD